MLEVAVMGAASARMHRLTDLSRTVVRRRPRRRALEAVGVCVDVTADERPGLPVEVEVRRTELPPRPEVPVLGGGDRETGRAGFGVVASHLLESVELRSGRGRRHAATGALLPLGRASPRR